MYAYMCILFSYQSLPYNIWSQYRPNNLASSARSLSDGHIPLIFHTWVKPELDSGVNSNGVKLHNGTLIYYVAPPWGGIRSSSPTSSPPHDETTTSVSNSLSDPDDLSTISPGKEIERQSLFEDPTRQSGYASPAGWKPPTIDITTPPSTPNREGGGPWGHGHYGFGWSTATQLYDKLPETTTNTNPTRSSEIGINTTTVSSLNANQTTTLLATTEETTTTTASTTTTTTADPIAANTNARFPVSDSVRKFRRIVAQIRAITKNELSVATARKSKS